jgi:zinc transport system substrate-binding protein
MQKTSRLLPASLAALLLLHSPAYAECSLKIGASLHPYYSWAKNIVGDAAEVTPLIPSGVDPHSYQAVASDMQMLAGLNVVIVNGTGHDEFITPMLKAIDNPKLQVIDTSKGLPLIPSFNDKKYAFEEEEGGEKVSYNSHTYIAITGAIQQMQMITRQLAKHCPDQAGDFIKNMRAYAAKLRAMLQATITRLDGLNLGSVRIATVHDGYSYLFQELGIEVSAVVQPRHGVTPSSKQLEDTIKRIKKANVNVLFGELDYEKKYVDIIFQETGCRLYALSHISNGEYTKEFFEETMQKNLDIIVQALSDVAERSAAASGPGGIPVSMSKQMQDTAQQMQGKMQETVKENLQKAVPETQQKQMTEGMAQKMQDTAQQMQEKMQGTVQENLQKAVPENQQKQMSESMSQKMQDTAQQMQGKMQETVQENLQKTVPETQQKQMNQKMQETAQKMQENIQQAAPAAQPTNKQ